MRAIVLCLGALLAVSHAHFIGSDRRSSVSCPVIGSTTPIKSSSTDNFESFHLHIAYSAGNTLEVSAVAKFLSYLETVAGAASSCGSDDTSDTSDAFCYSMTIDDYDASQKQDPFFNMDVFIFVGASYFTTALQFAQRYHSADMVGYDLTWMIHPNSGGCPGLDHLEWSMIGGGIQFPLNTCPFWFQSDCGFRRSAPAPAVTSHSRQLLTNTATSVSSTADCSDYTTWNQMVYLLYNSADTDETSAASTFQGYLATYLTNVKGSTVSQNDCDCSGYQAGASLTDLCMCAYSTTVASSDWFQAPYVAVGVFVPEAHTAKVINFFQRYRTADQIGTTLGWRVVPISNCPYYSFTKWSAWSVNTTTMVNPYPLLNPTDAFTVSDTATGGTTSDSVAMTPTASCDSTTVGEYTLYVPYMFNQLMSYSAGPMYWSTFTDAFESSSDVTGKWSTTATYASSDYSDDTTRPFVTAYREYSIDVTGLGDVLRYALMYRNRYSIDTTYYLYDQDLVVTPKTNCADRNLMQHNWHTSVVDQPVNSYSVGVDLTFGRRAGSNQLQHDTISARPLAAPSSRRLLSVASWYTSCVSAYSAQTRDSWLMYIYYVYNNPNSVTAVETFATNFATEFGIDSITDSTAYTAGTGTASSSVVTDFASVELLGYMSPSSDAIQEYALVISVPDASLDEAMLYASIQATGSSSIEANLGLYLVPNLETSTSGCTSAYLHSEFYLMQAPRAYLITDSATATATPSAAPTAVSTTYAANFEVELTGISSADFDADAQSSFSTVVAANSGSICGSGSASTCTSADVSISSTTRRSVAVSFSLGVYSSDSASSAVTTLSAYMNSGNFTTDLIASGASGRPAPLSHRIECNGVELLCTGLSGITGTSVTSATTSGSSDSSSGLSTGAIVGIVVGCVAFIAVMAVIIYMADICTALFKQNDCETDKSNEDCSSNHKEANPTASVPEMGHVNPPKADDHVPDNL